MLLLNAFVLVRTIPIIDLAVIVFGAPFLRPPSISFNPAFGIETSPAIPLHALLHELSRALPFRRNKWWTTTKLKLEIFVKLYHQPMMS